MHLFRFKSFLDRVVEARQAMIGIIIHHQNIATIYMLPPSQFIHSQFEGVKRIVTKIQDE